MRVEGDSDTTLSFCEMNLENVTSDGFRLFEFLHYHGLRNGGTCKFLPRTLSKVYCSSLDF